jgi:NAD(P) transhydrogenase subunit alpha
MIAGVVKETFPGENRVSLIPANIAALRGAGFEVLIEAGAGAAAGYPDPAYAEKGARVAPSRSEVFTSAEVILYVRGLGANPEAGKADLDILKENQVVIGMMEPLSEPDSLRLLAGKGVVAFAMELMPRITRAQSMDTLSSMATIAGYKAVLLAAEALPRMFPMMMTAAGTIAPAHVFVVGAGVAGLQAIASAKRLGAVVRAYDVRPAVKEQVESLGGKFVELELETPDAETSGGYARDMGEDFLRKQREVMTKVVADSDVVITTAAVPGKKAPVLITADMVRGMKPGSVIIDLAAERGGNCELTRAGEIVVEGGVRISGPVNLPASVPYHASQMYSKNITNFLTLLVKDGTLQLDSDDEIIRTTMVARGGKVLLQKNE